MIYNREQYNEAIEKLKKPEHLLAMNMMKEILLYDYEGSKEKLVVSCDEFKRGQAHKLKELLKLFGAFP